MQNVKTAYVAIGSNLASRSGDPAENVVAAISAVAQRAGRLVAASSLYRSPAFPAGSGPDFVNAVIGVSTESSPQRLLEVLHLIEGEFDRLRTVRWAARTLDLDLLGYGDHVLPDRQTYQAWRDLPQGQQAQRSPDTLILPHPRIQDRAFVLVPFAQIAPDWLHPVSGKSVRLMLNDLPRCDVETLKKL